MRQYPILILTLAFTFQVTAQNIRTTAFESILNRGAVLNLSPIGRDLEKKGMDEESRRKLLKKQYLTIAYNPCYIDEFKTLAYLRYNLYDDQMEFVKNENIYYLKKEKGRKIQFTIPRSVYKIYELDGDLEYFLVQVEGKSSLLVKQSSRFLKPRKATTSYGVDKPADFKRSKDVYYIVFNDESVVKIPMKKKELHIIFGTKKTMIKEYVKKNKLNPKNLEDLEKLVVYYNTL